MPVNTDYKDDPLAFQALLFEVLHAEKTSVTKILGFPTVALLGELDCKIEESIGIAFVSVPIPWSEIVNEKGVEDVEAAFHTFCNFKDVDGLHKRTTPLNAVIGISSKARKGSDAKREFFAYSCRKGQALNWFGMVVYLNTGTNGENSAGDTVLRDFKLSDVAGGLENFGGEVEHHLKENSRDVNSKNTRKQLIPAILAMRDNSIPLLVDVPR